MGPIKNLKYTKVSVSGEIEEHVDSSKKIKKKALGLPPHYLNLGLYLAVPLIAGVLVGQYLDKKFNTKAVFTISLLIFGTISVFYNLIKLYREDESTHKH